MKVEISPIPIEFTSGRRNCALVRMPLKLPQVHWDGQNDGPVTAAGVLNDSETSHSPGITAMRTPSRLAAIQPARWRGVRAAIRPSPRSVVGAGGGGAEPEDEDCRDDRHADEDEDRDGRPDAQVERVEQVVVPEGGHR